jgi:hypothetical protein
MKVNDGEKMFDQLFVLLQLQLLMDPSRGGRAYIRCTICQLLVLLYQRRHDLPAWQMLVRDASMYNEETGEMSFSILSRCVQQEQMAAKHKHLDNMYRMVPHIMSIEDDVHADSIGGRDGPKFNWRRVAKKEDETCLAMTAYLKQMCRSAALGTRQQYEGKNSESKCYKNAETGNRLLVPLKKTVCFWRNNVHQILVGDLLSTRNFTLTNFGCDNGSHIWPEMKYQPFVPPQPPAADDDQDGEGDAEGDEGDDQDGDQDEGDDSSVHSDHSELPLDLDNVMDQVRAIVGAMTSDDDEQDEGDEGDEGDESDAGLSDSSAEYEDDNPGAGSGRALYKPQDKSKKRKDHEDGPIFRTERVNRGNRGYDSNFVYQN